MPYYMLLVQKMTYCNLRVLYFSHNKTQTETAARQKGLGDSNGLSQDRPRIQANSPTQSTKESKKQTEGDESDGLRND